MNNEIIELLGYIKDSNFNGMLKYLPEGIQHRTYQYNTPEEFELMGSYEEDARYGYPAREKMIEACLEYCINILTKTPIELPSDEEIEKCAEVLYPINKGGSMFMPSRDDINKANKQEGFLEGAKWMKEQILNQNK